MESQDLGKASQPAYRAGSPPYKQAPKQVISRRRKNENVFKMSKDEKCTCKACKNCVFHCQVCKFVRFLLLPSSSWFLKLPIGLKEHTKRIHLDELVKGKKNGIMVGISDAGELIKPSELFVIWRKLKVSA